MTEIQVTNITTQVEVEAGYELYEVLVEAVDSTEFKGVLSVTGDGVGGTASNPVLTFPTSGQITEDADKRFVSDAQLAVIEDTSGVNTGDQDISGIATNAEAIVTLQNTKENSIAAGTTAQYWRGDKTFQDFGTAARASVLTGYTVGANTALADTDSILDAFGKVQGQINARVSSNLYSADGTILSARAINLGGFSLDLVGTSTSRFFANGRVGIGTTTDAGFRLDVNGTARVQGALTVTTQAVALSFGNNGTPSSGAGYYGTYAGSASNISQFQDATIIASSTTGSYSSFDAGSISTQNATFTIANKIGLQVRPTNKAGLTTITNEYGVLIGALNSGTNIYAIRSQVASAANRWNLYLDGTANNHLGGSLWIGTTSGTNTLDVNGTARIRTISNLGSASTNVLVPSSTGVLSLRTISEFQSDFLTTITGYNASLTQTLQHVSGVFQWV